MDRRLQCVTLVRPDWRNIAGIAVLVAGLAAWLAAPAFGGTLPQFERVRILEPIRQLTEVPLVDTAGEPFPLGDLKGKVALVFFGFTNCPDICPLTMQRLRELHASGLVDTDAVRFVLVSVDGERDTPEAMKAFLAGYSPDFIGLTGAPADLKKVANQFRAPFFKGNEAGSPQGGYTVAHSPQIYAVDAAGALRAEFYNASFEAMAGIAEALVAEYDSGSEVAVPD